MQGLLVPRRWTSQPQIPVGIDWSNPITRGLVGGILPTSSRFLVINSPLPKGTGATAGVCSEGVTVNCGTGIGASLNVLPVITTTSSITMLQVGCISSTIGDKSPFTLSHNGNSSTFVINESDGVVAGKVRGKVYVSGYLYCGGSVTLPVGSRYTAVLRHTNGVGQSLWLNGVLDSVTSAGTGATVGNSYYGSFNYEMLGALNAVWNRALSDAEIASISANPWQIFAPSL